MPNRIARAFALAAVPALFACGGETPSPAVPSTPSTTDATNAATASTVPATSSGTATLTPAGSAGSTKAERRTSSGWVDCHASYKAAAGADPASLVDGLAKACASTTGMHLVQSFKGSQAASNPAQSYPFHAEANHCYRAYAHAAAGIADLDLLIKDSTGAVAGEDSTDDPSPVVLENGAVCFKSADDASVVLSVGAGSGAYAIQVWSD